MCGRRDLRSTIKADEAAPIPKSSSAAAGRVSSSDVPCWSDAKGTALGGTRTPVTELMDRGRVLISKM